VQCPAGLLINGLQNGNDTHQGNSSAYSPIIPYTTHVLDAAVQTVNALHQEQAFDFGIFLGDATNSSAYNELRWYIDVIDGRPIHPNSDPISDYDTDYTREFKAAGLDKSIPWYQVLGNHDHLFLGTWAQTTKSLSAYTSEFIMDVDENLPNILNGTGYYGGVIDASTLYGVVKYAGIKTDFSPVPTIAANPDRRGITRFEWISEFFNTTSYPKGHGFTKNSNPDACYSFEPKAGLPLKVIVLDDTETDEVDDENGWLGYLDRERYTWLVNELDEGQNQDKLMIIAAHVPISLHGLWDDATANPVYTDLIAKLHTYPNLIMWISGHVHRNTVTKMPSPDLASTPNHPERGFWVVETSSLRDFPQQFRTFDIVRNNDNTISIIITNVDPSVKEGSPAAKSRSYAVAASQLFTAGPAAPLVATRSQAYNAELVKQLSPAMQIIIQEYGTPIH
jgi:metallophosphoesterase (TIGR03768 family)